MSWIDLDKKMMSLAEVMVKKVKTTATKEMLDSITQPTNFKTGGGGITPVLTGNLMSNTLVTLDLPSYGVNFNKDTSGSETKSKGMLVVAGARAWDIIYIQNNTPYNIQAEYKGWGRGGLITTPAYKYFSISVQNTFQMVRSLK